MIQRRSGLCLLHKALHSIRVSSISRQNLQRNFAIELRVLRQIHLAHPALANLRTDFITAESGAGRSGHFHGPANDSGPWLPMGKRLNLAAVNCARESKSTRPLRFRTGFPMTRLSRMV